MSTFRLILDSLRYHWRIHAAVALGVAAATAVLAGALIVGDSMRGSLRHLTLDRLGRINLALVTDRFFREELAEEWSGEPALQETSAEAVPAILLRVTVENPNSEPARRANGVNLVGATERFWTLGAGGPPQPPSGREIVLNDELAKQLGAKVGEQVLVRLPRLSTIPAENPLGRRSETIETQRLTVAAIIPTEGLGRFSLRPSQQRPRNAYVSLEVIQDRLDQPGKANAIFVAGPGERTPSEEQEAAIVQALHPKLADYGLHLMKTDRGYTNLTTDRMIFGPGEEAAIERALPPRQPALTYLANTIALGDCEIPYSTITAVDFAAKPPLGPMLSLEGKPLEPLADGEIALNSWAADDLQANPGDTIRLSYFEPESTQGQVRETSVSLRLAAIVELSGAAADPAFTPEVPGVTDQLSISDWNPPFPFDARRVRKKDEEYWDKHRGTPKAFVSLATGRKLWASRFGQTTSFRMAENVDAAKLDRELAEKPAAMGLVVQPVKRQGLAASAGTTPFEGLFLGFSMFIIAAAVMLVVLLFRLGIDRRAAELGILTAVGLRRRKVLGLLSGEGLVVAAAGSLVGLLGGVGYAALMLAGLRSWWLAAVVTPFLELFVTPTSLAIGFVAGVIVALAAIVWSARRAVRNPPRQLLAGQVTADGLGRRKPGRWSSIAAATLLVIAIAISLVALGLDQQAQAGAFFGAGAAVLAAALVFARSRLAAGRTGAAVAAGRGNLARLSLRNAARNPGRSTLTIGLVAAASFLIVAVSAFQMDPSQDAPRLDSGNGGFAVVAESDQPIFQNLNSPEGREELGFSADDEAAMEAARVMPIRVRPGDDASCLNLYRPQQPRVLGVPQQFIDRGGFAWASFDQNHRAERGDDASNPWRLLDLDLGIDPDGVPRVPVILENNTAMYSLHLYGGVGETFDIADGRGGNIRLQIVGLLGGSILQGDLIVSESQFLRHFPEQSGYRFFLIEAEPKQVPLLREALERTLGDYGLTTETTGQRLAAFLAVQNTYLSTFQRLGGLGLLLGTFGLAAVQLRSVLERRRELALLQAVGFRRRRLAGMVMLENAVLLVGGLACGVLAALVAVLPHMLSGEASIPWLSLLGTLGMVLAVGLLAGTIAVRAALATPLLAALRGE